MTGISAPDHHRAAWRASPNFGKRRNQITPWILLLHYTGMETGAAAEDWLCAAASEVSSHYLVHEDGRIVQMVREADRAWHAGLACWRGESDINSASIGIEVVNGGHAFSLPDFPQLQIDSLVDLCRDICARHAIEARHVLGHSDVAIGRKIDPGERLPWDLLWRQGVGHFAEVSDVQDGPELRSGATGQPVQELQSGLAFYGYQIAETGRYDAATEACVAAFQRHFRRHKVDGVADAETRAVLRQLIATLPAA